MRIHLLPLGSYQTNCYIVHADDSKTCAIIDPGYDPEKILFSVNRLGLAVDAILLTGGLMRFDDIADGIRKRCGWIAPVTIYPGEMEQEALAYSTLKVLRGEKKALTYTGKPVWDGFGF